VGPARRLYLSSSQVPSDQRDLMPAYCGHAENSGRQVKSPPDKSYVILTINDLSLLATFASLSGGFRYTMCVPHSDEDFATSTANKCCILFPTRDDYTVSQLPGGEGGRFAVAGVVCSREDVTLVLSHTSMKIPLRSPPMPED
jgi:hypothetical protein